MARNHPVFAVVDWDVGGGDGDGRRPGGTSAVAPASVELVLEMSPGLFALF